MSNSVRNRGNPVRKLREAGMAGVAERDQRGNEDRCHHDCRSCPENRPALSLRAAEKYEDDADEQGQSRARPGEQEREWDGKRSEYAPDPVTGDVACANGEEERERPRQK